MATGKPILLVLLFCSTALCSVGQNRDSLHRLYNDQTLYRFGSNFKKGTERLYFRDLRDEFSFSPIGQYQYTEAKKHRTTATVLRVLSAAATIASLSFISNENRTATYIAWGGQIGLNLAGFYFQDRSNKHLDNALWQRNKDLLFGK